MRHYFKKSSAVLFLTAITLALVLSACSSDASAPAYTDSTASTYAPSAATSPETAPMLPNTAPADILPRLEKAYNDQDLYAIVECFEPSMAEVTFGFLELFGVKGNAMKQIVPFFSKMLGASGSLDNGQWGTTKLSEISTERNGSSATLKYSVSLTFSDGSTQNLEDTIQTVLINDVWYIAAIQVPMQGSDGGVTGVLPQPFDGVLYTTGSSSSGYGFMDENGNIIISKQYKNAGSFVNGYCAVFNGSYWGFIDKANRLVIPYEYQDYHNYTDDLFPVKMAGYWGCLDESGNTVIEFTYTHMDSIQYGRIPVSINGVWGVVDTSGNYVIPLSTGNEIYGIDYITDSFIVCEDVRKREGVNWIDYYPIYNLDGKLLRSDLREIVGYGDGVLFVHSYDTEVRAWYAEILGADGQAVMDLTALLSADIAKKMSGAVLKPPANMNTKVYITEWLSEELANTWKIIEIRTNMELGGRFRNYINNSGELLLDEWSAGTPSEITPYGYFSITTREGDEIKNAIYDTSGTCVYETQFLDTWSAGISVLNGRVSFFRSFHGACVDTENRQQVIIDFATGAEWTYADVKISGPRTAIVSDGVFYGLVVNGELVFPIEYTRISNNSGSNIYTFEKGTNKFDIGVTVDGEIIYS